ncbi:MAG: hypothetical protein R3F30_01515 [Planctomycetota bacterium]
MRVVIRLAAVAAALLPLACRAPVAVEPLDLDEDLAMHYEGQLTASSRLELGDDATRASEAGEARDGTEAAPAGALLRVRVIALGHDLAAGLLRSRGQDPDTGAPLPFVYRAGLVRSDRLDATLTRLPGEGMDVVEDTRVRVPTAGKASLTVVNQVSFVRGFELEAEPHALIADPVIDVVQEGLLLELEDRGDGQLGTVLHRADLVRPIASLDARLFAAGAPVSLQVPLVHAQKLSGGCTLAPGHALVLVLRDPTDRTEGLETALLVVERAH